MEKVRQFARYLEEGFAGKVPVWDFRPDRETMDQTPAGIVVGPARELDGRLNVAFTGSGISVLENSHRPARKPAPDDFRVVALMPVYNEADILRGSLRYLNDQGIEVYVLDNWSTDGSYNLAREFLSAGVIGIERFPKDGPTRIYDWRSILGRIEALAEQLSADWFLFHDADERRHSPWPGLDLRAGFYYADRCGFNCIDHMVLNFHPTVCDEFDESRDVEAQLRFFEFSNHEGHFHQRKAWKKPGSKVALASTAGHDIRFPNRLVYPFKFLMKHYPVRSQEHGERKVWNDRANRWSEEERALGWHKQYDGMASGESFLRDPASLTCFDEKTFYEDYLIERLSGIGVFHAIPWWATGPRYNSADER